MIIQKFAKKNYLLKVPFLQAYEDFVIYGRKVKLIYGEIAPRNEREITFMMGLFI